MRIQYSMKNGVVLPTVESSDGCRCIYWYNINPNPNPSAKKQPQFRVLWDSNTIHDSCIVVSVTFSYDNTHSHCKEVWDDDSEEWIEKNIENGDRRVPLLSYLKAKDV